MKTATKSSSYKYWKYVPIHTGKLLVIYHCSALVMKGFEQDYTINKYAKMVNIWYNPTKYHGINSSYYKVPDTGEMCWPMSGDA